jgi:hypothetical protein
MSRSWVTGARNLSGGFWRNTLEQIEKYHQPFDDMILVSENEEVVPFFRERFPELCEIDCLGYSGDRAEKYTDLNIRQEFTALYELVVCQALLEHMSNPSMAIQNMCDLALTDGHIFIHTVGPGRAYHAWPIDCLRFFEDFFRDLEKYMPLKVVEYQEQEDNIFVVYQKVNG